MFALSACTPAQKSAAFSHWVRERPKDHLVVPENKVESLYPATSTGPEILCEYLEKRVFTVSAPSPQPLPSPPSESCSGTVLEHQVGTSPSMIWLKEFADITFFSVCIGITAYQFFRNRRLGWSNHCARAVRAGLGISATNAGKPRGKAST